MAANDMDVSAKQRPDGEPEPNTLAPGGQSARTEGTWRSRRVAAFGVQALAVGGPILLGTLTARVVSQLFGPHTSIWLVSTISLGTGVAVSVVVARLAARLLPLALLLRMTMLFPDRAPNRIKVARRATSKDELAQRLAHPDSDVREAATTLLALVTALGRHDRKTRGHSERVRLYCDLVGTELGLDESERGRLRWVGLLHDIGKLEVAAAILNKPGKLTGNEWETVRTHPDTGAKLAGPLADWLGPWFAGIREHHEHFDGSGYPRGLAGEHISLAGRAVSVVDAFETMTAARSYKSPMTTVAARAELARCAGTHFDPNVVRAFLTIALPKLLWTMGPLTFLVNFPFLRWIPTASIRAADVAAAGVNTAAGAVGVTAVTVAAATAHAPIIHAHGPAPARLTVASAAARQLSRTPHAAALPGQPTTPDTASTVRLPAQPDTTIDAAGSGTADTSAGTVAAGQDGIHPHAAAPAAGQPASTIGTSGGSSDLGSSGSSSSGSGSSGSGSPGSSGSDSSGSNSSGRGKSGKSGSGKSGSGKAGKPGSGKPSSGSGKSGSGSSSGSGSGSSGSGSSGSGSSGSGSGSSGSGSSGSGSSGSSSSGSGSSGTSGGSHRKSGGLPGGLM